MLLIVFVLLTILLHPTIGLINNYPNQQYNKHKYRTFISKHTQLALNTDDNINFPSDTTTQSPIINLKSEINQLNPTSLSTTSDSSIGVVTNNDVNWDSISQQITEETKEIIDCLSIVANTLLNDTVKVEDIVLLCDEIDQLVINNQKSNNNNFRLTEILSIRLKTLEFRRYELLVKLMKQDYNAYIATASFLSPNRILRIQLPNVQDVPYNNNNNNNIDDNPKIQNDIIIVNGEQFVVDCELDNMKYNDNILDTALLYIFRKLVTKNTGGVTSDKPGILGLLDQGRTFMLQTNQTAEAQHDMVYNTLGGLMTPVLPPFYRIFMSGIIPNIGNKDDYDKSTKQLGPWFYAPFLTTLITPIFFQFLVGPSYMNRHKNGNYGGLLVEKCKFLQESNCKGLCLNQCKIPAQNFFTNELGLSLSVIPNFVTQECQWNFNEIPIAVEDDPTFPKGCIVGCESRKAIVTSGTKNSANLCM